MSVSYEPIARYALGYGVEKKVILKNYDSLPDGLHAYFCGTGSPMPDRDRSGACLAVIAGQDAFLFDAGEGAEENLTLMGLKPSNINQVFLTHFHSDHIGGLPSLSVQRVFWGGAASSLQVYGGPGVDRVTSGFNAAYSLDHLYRSEHHGENVTRENFMLTPVEIAADIDQELVNVFESNGVRIFAFKVDHSPVTPAIGYRVEYGGRSLCYTGDTKLTPTLKNGCKNVDLLVSEAISPEMTRIMSDKNKLHGFDRISGILEDTLSYHITPDEITQVALEANVSQVALTHLFPIIPSPFFEELFLGKEADEFPVRTSIMNDGNVISLPVSGGTTYDNAF